MEIIGAAALIAVGIVVAAVLYGRTHGQPRARRPSDAATAAALQAALTRAQARPGSDGEESRWSGVRLSSRATRQESGARAR